MPESVPARIGEGDSQAPLVFGAALTPDLALQFQAVQDRRDGSLAEADGPAELVGRQRSALFQGTQHQQLRAGQPSFLQLLGLQIERLYDAPEFHQNLLVNFHGSAGERLSLFHAIVPASR
jgi:hypothetical protein